MKITIENIGVLGKISVELAGITVIAGENDSGKSTIGKIFFALVHAFSNYPVLLQQERKESIRRQIERIFFELRRNFDLSQFPQIRESFSPPLLIRRIELLDEAALLDMSMMLNTLKEASPDKATVLKLAQDRLDKLRDYVRIEISDKDAIANSIFKALQSEFGGEIVNKSQTNNAKITLSDGETNIFDVTLSDSGIIDFHGGENMGLEDATFVEGPAVIQFNNAMSGYSPLGESNRTSSGSIPFHTLDLSQKLRNGKFGLFNLDNSNSNLNLGNIYKGKVYFDDEEKSFFLRKGNYRVSSDNIASGVKALGLIDMLISGGYVGERMLLILDEPETNLHPKWQIEYAKVLCELASRGATILVTTHSPYMLEALKGFVGKFNAKANFYLASKSEDNEINYVDTTTNISPIIRVLSDPLSKLIDDISDEF